MRRRTLLRSLAVSVPLALAGCSGDGDGETDADDETPTTTMTEPDGSGATETPTPTEMATATGTPTRTDDGGYDDGGYDNDTATPTSTGRNTATPTDTATPTATPAQTAQVVEVAPDGSLSFAPESFDVSTGDTVAWVWRAGGHNVKADSTPGGSDWSGTPGDEFDTFGSGHRYSYTFETAGEYTYYCGPHEGAGMTGSFTVSE